MLQWTIGFWHESLQDPSSAATVRGNTIRLNSQEPSMLPVACTNFKHAAMYRDASFPQCLPPRAINSGSRQMRSDFFRRHCCWSAGYFSSARCWHSAIVSAAAAASGVLPDDGLGAGSRAQNNCDLCAAALCPDDDTGRYSSDRDDLLERLFMYALWHPNKRLF